MRKLILIILFIITQGITSGQNLVPNPSFEEYSECPFQNGQLPFALPWFTDLYHFGPLPSGINGSSSEYFNMCDSTTGGTAHIYLIQKPRTGYGMAAFGTYYEYIEVILTKPLKSNKTYCISYYVSLFGLSRFACDALCACFTNDSLLNTDSNIPRLICGNRVCNETGNIIKDTINWVKVNMDYNAIGGEQFITIGNFKAPSEINEEDTGHPGGWSTYYFIDDVAVYECDTPVYPANVPDQSPCKGETVALGSQTRPQYLYEWKDATGNIISDQGSITIVADTSTYYVLKQKDFKFDETTDTCFITVEPFCLHIPNVITPNNDGINDFFVIDGGSELTVDLQLFNRWGKLVYHSKHYQNNWPVNDIADGVYFYIIKATSVNGEVREYQGSVSVLR